MKLYRNCNIEDIFFSGYKVVVRPKRFISNPDSTCESGIKSFWYDSMIILSYHSIIVEANFEPREVGECSLTLCQATYDYDVFEKSVVKIKEYTTSNIVYANIQNCYIPEFLLAAGRESEFLPGLDDCACCTASDRLNFVNSSKMSLKEAYEGFNNQLTIASNRLFCDDCAEKLSQMKPYGETTHQRESIYNTNNVLYRSPSIEIGRVI